MFAFLQFQNTHNLEHRSNLCAGAPVTATTLPQSWMQHTLYGKDGRVVNISLCSISVHSRFFFSFYSPFHCFFFSLPLLHCSSLLPCLMLQSHCVSEPTDKGCHKRKMPIEGILFSASRLATPNLHAIFVC